MSREDPQMKIRLPVGLKHSIESAAKANNRTMNAEIVARLQGSFSDQGAAKGGDEISDLISRTVVHTIRELRENGWPVFNEHRLPPTEEGS